MYIHTFNSMLNLFIVSMDTFLSAILYTLHILMSLVENCLKVTSQYSIANLLHIVILLVDRNDVTGRESHLPVTS